MEGNYCYKYPRPAVTTDCVVCSVTNHKFEVLLVKRANEPFKDMWALPGGFLEENETLEGCACRELEEETGLSGVRLKQFEAFSEVNRDPRGRTISVAFVGEVEKEKCAPKAADDAKEVAWFALEKLPELAFDHRTIIARAMSWYLMAEMLMLMSEEESRQSEDTKNGK